MNLKEFFKSQVLTKPTASRVGSNRFRVTLDKENIKTPHYVMSKIEDMVSDRISIQNGLRLLTLFVMPDLKFNSSDEKTAVFANEWLDQRDDMERELFNFILIYLGGGNGYLEPTYTKKGVLDMLYNMPTPSTVYYNLQRKSDDEYWVVEYPQDVFSIEGQKLKFYQISYTHGSYTWRNNVWGIAYPKHHIHHLKFLWSKSPWYANGLLSGAIDNEDVAEEILKNWALAAKYRSLSKKIIAFYNQDGESIDPSEIDSIRQDLQDLEEEESLLVNKRVESHDLTFNGADNMMQQELEFLRRDTGGSLTPNYMTPFSQDTSLATASEAKVPFALSINSTQRMIEGFLNNLITENLKKNYPFLHEDLHLSLGEADLYSRNENFMNVTQLYNYGAATFNEFRKSAGLSVVDGGDRWGWKPPLDKTTTNVTVQERMKVATLKEKYKEVLSKIEKVKYRKFDVVLKEVKEEKGNEKELTFKEAVKNLLK